MTLKNDNQPYPILQKIICNKKTVFMMLTKKPSKYGLNKPYFKGRLMDLRGIEPLSENLFRTVSPITVSILTFPLSGV